VIAWEEIPGYQFDCINAEQIFEHLPNPLETLQYISQSLKPNGVIRISVPNGWDIRNRLKILDWAALKGSKNTLYPISPLEHINCFNHDALVRMAELAGLAPIQVSAQMGKKRFMDFTLRDILGPGYRMMKKMSGEREIGSTHLFFQKGTHGYH
jgi:SAM-dependent methyltransferase